MKLNVVVLVWGRDYIYNFCHYALPAMLSPGNLPTLSRLVETELLIFTRPDEIPLLDAETDPRVAECLHKTVKFQLCELPLDPMEYGMPACAIENVAHRRIFDWVKSKGESLVWCPPDVMWSDGSFGYIGRALAAGKTAVLLSSFRVVTETIIHDVKWNGLLQGELTPLVASRLLLRHAHPVLAASHYATERCPPHPEYIMWPVGNEGLIFYHMVHAVECCTPHLVKWTGQELLSEENDPESIEVTSHSNQLLGLSLSPLGQCANWIKGGEPISATMLGQFLCRLPSALIGIMSPVLVPTVENPTQELWDKELATADRYFWIVRQIRSDILHGVLPHGPGSNIPQTYENLSWEDAELFRKMYYWAPEDCVTVKLLDRIAGDGW